jgi:hypothetical protein
VPAYPVPGNKSTSPEPRTEAPSSVTPSRTPSLGHRPLTFIDKPEQFSWRHWPLPVVTILRNSGMAPLRFDTGTAGGLLTKRSPAGIFYRERVGWYLGSDLQGREVFVRIRATQALRSLDPEGRRLATDGSWGVTTNAWLLRERKRLSWSGNTRADESGSSAASAREEVRTIPMPDLFIWCLMGVPSGPQRAVLEAIDFPTTRPWGDARAWGHTEGGPCSHSWQPCEHVVLAAMDGETVVVMQAQRFPSGWESWAVRALADEVRDAPGSQPTVNRGHDTEQLKSR